MKMAPVHVAFKHWIADALEVVNPTDAESAVESIQCQRFLVLSAEKRLRAILINKDCAN